MEKGGATNSNGGSTAFSIFDNKKKTSSNTSSTTTYPFPSNLLITGLHHHQTHPDHHHQLSSSANNASLFHPSYKPPGGGFTTEFPFTEAQWKELERQAMIYKCMISSVPVPHHLLFPLSTNFPSAYGGGYSRKGDPEPGRCKRTDGKKWRCSREVAPLQKYCERHLHRGRPRSRKPVEPNTTNKKTRLHQTKAKTDLTISTPTPTNTHRDLGSKQPQPWEDLMGGYNSSSFDQDYSALNLFSYPNFPTTEMELPTTFIIDSAAVSASEGDLSPSLNLSMSSAAVAPLPWERGGPLGEALQASPYNSRSTPANTAVSSPTGVLHWTLFSNSDGSVCNSPTLAAEISNQWQI